MHAVLADRAEQRLGESAMSLAAHHQHVRAACGPHQHLGGMPSTTDERMSTSGSTLLTSFSASVRILRASPSKSVARSVTAAKPYLDGNRHAVTASTSHPVSSA